jgi:hypothetical protein
MIFRKICKRLKSMNLTGLREPFRKGINFARGYFTK